MTGETESASPSRVAPIYVSYSTFVTLLDWLRDLPTIPSQFDRTFWGDKFGGSTGTQLMSGLRFLGLLKNDVPTDQLDRLARADTDGRKPLLRDLLTSAYGVPLVEGLARMTPKMVNEALDGLGTTDATREKARSFFINAAKAADVPMQPGVAKQARNRPGASQRNGSRRKKREQPADKTEQVTASQAQTETVLQKMGLKAPLIPLLEDLAKIGPKWDQAEHDGWHTAFKTLADYAYPVRGGEKGD
jgi:hypothetical protein